ncbi:hypothetical protein [Streptomyces sp. NBC_00829]|uniref:hypothetical protein n=1 Tax=Streptomyces sp. NBC_00829 TaxID=2903679 RepID=UPI00386583E2|nr:hypothetical protein OG293_37895 [Streptomyces sp. NBC_00829]
MLQDQAVVPVCGDATRMAPEVRRALTGIFASRTGTSAGDADAWFTGLRQANRFLEDIWGAD